MSGTPDLAALGTMIAASQGWPAAKAVKAYCPTDADKATVANLARDLLDIYPDTIGACAPMSAAFAAGLERVLSAPIQVVAGSLFADGTRVFGGDAPFDGAASFAEGDLDWDGHVWVMIGAYVADISLFRTAYSRFAHPVLGRHVAATFGHGKGMYFDAWRHTTRLGLRYAPRHVLTRAQVDGLLGHAHATIKGHRQASG
jgi:hypothetical protein